MTNTERLIASFEHGQKYGYATMDFAVGKYTGNGPSVVAALRRRGYVVVGSCTNTYTMSAKPAAVAPAI